KHRRSVPIATEAYGRRVVNQRIEPHVDDTARIERKRYAPGLSRATHGDVLEAAFDQPENLIASDVRLQEFRMRGKVLEQRFLVLRQPEEVILLLDPLRRRQMQRTLAVDEILFLLEGFAANAVPPLVHALVNIAGLV